MRLAARGARDLDRGREPIADRDERDRLRWQARQVWIEGVIGGIILTAMSILLPAWPA